MSNPREHAIKVGLISDTHGLLRAEAIEALRGVDFLVHAGDIGSATILRLLGELAPITAVRGNNDMADWATNVPLTNTITVGEVQIHVIHEINQLDRPSLPDATRAVIYGHSHRPAINLRDGILYVNPGSAGPRRFKLPVTVAVLYVTGISIDAEIVTLV